MTDEEIERLAMRILQRMQPPVLVIVTAADGYRDAIRHRLAGCGLPLHLVLNEDITDATQWQAVGETLPAAVWQEALPSTPYRALLLPFLDYPLAADLVNGTLRSPVTKRLHEALLAGLPVLALSYHCDPASELNQLRGSTADSAYAAYMRTMLARLAECGVTLCTMNELLTRLASGTEAAARVSGPRRYLTVADIMNNPTLASAHNAVLTDAALELSEKQKKTPLP